MRVIGKDLREGDPQGSSHNAPPPGVLCVDLDGTLLKTDLIWECIISLLKVRPFLLMCIPFWLLEGRAILKRKLAQKAVVDVTTLPYRSELLDFVSTQRQQGRRIVLVTAAEGSLAESIANQIGLFDEVLHSEDGRNLKGKAKAELLRSKFSHIGFDYIGNSTDDLPVWKAARGGYVVGDRKLVRRASSVVAIKGVFERQTASVLTWFRALRGHHWAKNLLLFLPLFLAHKLHLQQLLTVAAGFLLFSFCASSIYILNDLLDLHSDRAHPWKGKRPFASGETSIAMGLLVSALLVTTTIAISFWLSVPFGAVVAT